MEIPKPNNENFPLDIHETHGRRSKHSHRLAVNLLDLHQWSVVISSISQKFTDQLFLLPFAFDFNSANRKFEKTKAKWCTLAHVSVSVSLPLEVYFGVCAFFSSARPFVSRFLNVYWTYVRIHFYFPLMWMLVWRPWPSARHRAEMCNKIIGKSNRRCVWLLLLAQK